MKTLEEKKLLVNMMRLFGQPVDHELIESIKREEELNKAFFKEPVQQPKIEVQMAAEPIVQPIIESPIKILKTDFNPRLTKTLENLSKGDLIDIIEGMTPDIDIMELYGMEQESLIHMIRDLSKRKSEPVVETPKIVEAVAADNKFVLLQNEFENIQKKLDLLLKRFNNSLSTGGGGGAVRMSDLDDLIAKRDIIPDLDEVFSLGSPDKRFKDLYLSGNTITLGNTTIGAATGNGGGLVIGDTIVGSNVAPVTVTAAAFKSMTGPIDENEAEVAASYTVTANKYAKSVGPIKLNKSVVFKIPKTSKWKIFA